MELKTIMYNRNTVMLIKFITETSVMHDLLPLLNLFKIHKLAISKVVMIKISILKLN